MRIADFIKIDLQQDGVYDFLWSAQNSKPEIPLSIQAGYVLADPQHGGKQPLTAPQPMVPITTARREYYAVLTQSATGPGSKIGSFDVIVPITYSLNITVYRNLLVLATLTPDVVTQITNVFAQYNFATDGDPNVYAKTALAAGGGHDQDFQVAYTYTLDKVGAPPFVEDTAARDKLIGFYAGQGQGTIFDPISGLPALAQEYFPQRFKVEKTGADEIHGPAPATAPPPTDVYEHPPGAPAATTVIDQVVQKQTAAGCPDVDEVTHKVADLLQWPEFKVQWEDRQIQIGCITIIATVPIIYTRTGTKSLWYYVGKPRNLSGTLLNTVETCAGKAAVAGAVIGIVLADPGAAADGFIAVFQTCVEFTLGRYLDCLSPGIMLEDEVSPWVALY